MNLLRSILCSILLLAALVVILVVSPEASGQAFGEPDGSEPGDRMIQEYLARETAELHAKFSEDVASLENWKERRQQLLEEYYHMLGLWPLPARTPLQATITGTVEGDGFVVDLLHYQSIPGLYVTANLYRPASSQAGEKHPAVLYVCGHSSRGRNGNKTAFQSHGIWFARHGYVCLIVDTLQLGEIAATHHGTYREQRWWWHSRGYTPAGVECWNGVRGIDYLVSRPDVDPERIGVTGISGGGAATFWVACADERVKVAVPVSGMADLPSYVSNRVINGHCDCMFLYNTFQWPWTRIAALFAPRPLLFANSDNDPIFPMDANERVINRLERLYSLYGTSHQVDALVSIGGHAYRQDIRQGVSWFFNTHLKNDPRPVTDTEQDVVGESEDSAKHPIAPERLRVFATDEDIPSDQLNTTIDEHFVPRAEVTLPEAGQFEAWKSQLQAELRRVAFRALPERIAAAKQRTGSDRSISLETEEGIVIRARDVTESLVPNGSDDTPRRVVLLLATEDIDAYQVPQEVREQFESGDRVFLCEPRGIGPTRWTRRNPPNYVERSHVLLGRTVDTGRVEDAIAVARYLQQALRPAEGIYLAGSNAAAVWAAYAALWEPEIQGVVLHQPPLTHMDGNAPQFLNILRVADVPELVGMLAPRRLQLLGMSETPELQKIRAIYRAAGADEQLSVISE